MSDIKSRACRAASAIIVRPPHLQASWNTNNVILYGKILDQLCCDCAGHGGQPGDAAPAEWHQLAALPSFHACHAAAGPCPGLPGRSTARDHLALPALLPPHHARSTEVADSCKWGAFRPLTRQLAGPQCIKAVSTVASHLALIEVQVVAFPLSSARCLMQVFRNCTSLLCRRKVTSDATAGSTSGVLEHEWATFAGLLRAWTRDPAFLEPARTWPLQRDTSAISGEVRAAYLLHATCFSPSPYLVFVAPQGPQAPPENAFICEHLACTCALILAAGGAKASQHCMCCESSGG